MFIGFGIGIARERVARVLQIADHRQLHRAEQPLQQQLHQHDEQVCADCRAKREHIVALHEARARLAAACVCVRGARPARAFHQQHLHAENLMHEGCVYAA